MRVEALGVDAAFANMGLARVRITQEAGKIKIDCLALRLVKTEPDAGKTVRKSSDTFRRGRILHEALDDAIDGCGIVFAEIPSGSQSASAAKALGVAVGVLASCKARVIEVDPMEIKRLFTDRRRVVSKAEIIQWAAETWPRAPWLMAGKGKTLRLIKDNEHLADAMATVMAGIKTPEFQQLLTLHHAISSPDHNRLAPDRLPRLRVPLDTV